MDNLPWRFVFTHHQVFMSSRASTDDENGWIPLHMLLSPTRHSRAGGNPGLVSAEFAWIPAFAGMTEPWC